MGALFAAAGLFVLAWVIHLAEWRLARPARTLRSLVLIFGGVLVVGLGSLALAGWPVFGRHEAPGVVLFYAGAACSYAIAYLGIEEPSPSLAIVRRLRQAGGEGCTREELIGLFARQHVVAGRLRSLADEGLVSATPLGGQLTWRGLRLARAAAVFARAFNLGEGA